jgi:trans-aconitate methyltransferase
MLRPALARLSPAESERFLAEYSRRVSEAFPPRVIAGQPVEALWQARIFVVGQSPG